MILTAGCRFHDCKSAWLCIKQQSQKKTFYLQNSKERKDEKKKFNACLQSEILSATVSGGEPVYNFKIQQEVLSPVIDSTCMNLYRYAKFGNEVSCDSQNLVNN